MTVTDTHNWKLKAAQSEKFLKSIAGPDDTKPFHIWIDYYSDDNEPIPKKDEVAIDVEDFRIVPSPGRSFIKGTIVDGPAGLISKNAEVRVDFGTYEGVLYAS